MAQMKETSVEKVNQINRNSVTTIKVKMAVNETPSRNPNNPPTTEAPFFALSKQAKRKAKKETKNCFLNLKIVDFA